MRQFVFSLKQHIGEICLPKIKKNDQIKIGQEIASAPPDSLGVPIQSSINGKVLSVSKNEIVIEESKDTDSDYQKLEKKAPIDLIKEAGIVGLGGAGFPTYKKLEKKIPDGFLLINAAECEPILSHNIERIKKSAKEILKGIKLLLEITEAKQAIIAIKKKNIDCISLFSSLIDTPQIIIKELPDLYPMGEERAIIRETMSTLLSANELPYVANAVVLNIETVYRIYEAVFFKKPLITKDVTLAGRLGESERVKVLLDQPIGLPIGELLEEFAPNYLPFGEIILGGPYTGKRGELTSTINKTTGGILLTIPFPKLSQKVGLLVCACGLDKERMIELAESMSAEISGIEYCKQAIQIKNGSYKCSNPGECPGQAGKVLNLRKQGAEVLLIGNCSDCTNTVMSIAPKLKLPVYHTTDFALRATGDKLIRKLKLN